MDKKLLPYYLSRTAISIAFGILLYATGSSTWFAVLTYGIMMAFFLWALHSGRYAVHPEFGATALRRDERTQMINDKAARNAFVISMLAVGILSVYFFATGAAQIAAGLIRIILLIGVASYYASDLWLRQIGR